MQWLDEAPEGVRLAVDAPLAEVEAAAASATTLVLEFGTFRDGRGLSLAAVLRERGYRGRLIAAGHVLPDQARHLRRSGFDGVVVGADADRESWRRMDEAFSAHYQPAEDAVVPVWRRRASPAAPAGHRAPRDAPARLDERLAEGLNRVATTDPQTILRVALKDNQGLRPAVLSSFGAEAAVLLSFVARIDPAVPVIFLDTGMHFLQTLAYRQAVADHFGLTDVRIVRPMEGDLVSEDPADDLWSRDPDGCCDIRKVRPLERALQDVDLLITGRKRRQTAARAEMQPFEFFEGRIRVNPLLEWSTEEIEARFEIEGLPRHPLSLQGYPSIGCWPCTRAVAPAEPARAGRWAHAAKTECGIHLARRARMVD